MPGSAHYSLSVRFAEEFLPSVRELTRAEQERVWNTVQSLQVSPTSPGLNLKKLNGSSAAGAVWSARASKELRILLRLSGPVAVLVHAGHHDATYRRAPRINSPQSAPVEHPSLVIDSPADVQPSKERHSKSVASELLPRATDRIGDEERPQALLWMWTNADLREALNSHQLTDVSDEQLEALVKATDTNAEDVLLGGWPGDASASIRADLLDVLVELSDIPPDEWREAQLTTAEEAAVRRFAEAITARGATAALSVELDAEAVQRLAAAPIEDWMIFLHPSQREIVEREFRGAARVRGSAGTGKTTVALHRAAWLARNPPQAEMFSDEPLPILFTTYIKSLVPVLESLYGRLPAAVPDAIEFTNIDHLAMRLCDEAGALRDPSPQQVANMFARAKREVIRVGTPLYELKCSDNYLSEEIRRVIVGRGVDNLETYLDIQRIGREVPFQRAVREQVWELHLAWRNMMDEKGLEHFEDRVRRARDHVRLLPEARYRSVIVDESQDLTQTGLELLVALVGRRVFGGHGAEPGLVLGADSLLIVGDGAQRVYPGGYTLLSAGVDVRGRGVTLGHNYRNTRQIIEAAMACTGEQVVADLEDAYDAETRFRRADAPRESDRDGVPPRLVIAADAANEHRYVVEEIARLRSSDALRLGDLGIFAATNEQVLKAIGALEQTGLGCLNLRDFRGKATDEVKVGTFDRAKGLEFKVVFLLGVSHGAWPFTASRGLSPAERTDAEALAASKLFIAMTRARDALYVVCSEKPHRLIDTGRDHFETVRFPAT